MFDTLKLVALILAIIGAINWGLVGLLDINLVTLLFSKIPVLAKLIYTLVGVAGLILIPHVKDHLKAKF